MAKARAKYYIKENQNEFRYWNETFEFKTTTNKLKDSMKDIFSILNNGEVKGQMVSDSTLRDISRI